MDEYSYSLLTTIYLACESEWKNGKTYFLEKEECCTR